VIVGVDNDRVERVGQLQRLIAQHKPGESVLLRVVRYGEAKEFRIGLVEAEIPAPPETAPPNARPSGAGRLGIQVGELTTEMAREYGYERAGGAVVTAVADYGAADRKEVHEGMRITEINRKAIRTAPEAQNALRRLRSGQIVSLMLETAEGATLIRNVRVP
jgi:S1-C subfamily serine protease